MPVTGVKPNDGESEIALDVLYTLAVRIMLKIPANTTSKRRKQ